MLETGVVVHLCCTLFFCPASSLLLWSNEITQKKNTKRHVRASVLAQQEKKDGSCTQAVAQ